jgi:hypothetical protein
VLSVVVSGQQSGKEHKRGLILVSILFSIVYWVSYVISNDGVYGKGKMDSFIRDIEIFDGIYLAPVSAWLVMFIFLAVFDLISSK